MPVARGPHPRISIGPEPSQEGSAHWRPVWCSEHFWGNRARGIHECLICDPGPQVRTLWSPAFETLLGGARGGMKTETGRAWLLRGNIVADPLYPREAISEPTAHRRNPDGTPEHIMVEEGGVAFCSLCVNASYIAHPRYRALVLRENEKDLSDWIFRARLFYEPLGANVTEKPARVVWPSGATFILGHMKDESAYTDYMGQEFQRIVFEELTHIPDELRYLRIIGSCRSTYYCQLGCPPGTCKCGVLRRQILATSNPGGNGHGWVKKRFISIGGPNKVHIDPLSKQTRQYIPALITDNPYLMKDEGYVAWLEGLPEPTRSAWRYGDWDALSGIYFSVFRPKGPLAGEPPEANHVIRTGQYPLQPWWPRWLGGDWGYKHNFAFHWACQSSNGQIIIYDELVGNATSARELGSQVARKSFRTLEALGREGIDPVITLWFSPDAFGKRNEELTIAEDFVRGVEAVLGPGSAHFPDMWHRVDTAKADWEGNYYTEFKLQKKFGIAIRKAQNARIAGWQHMRELMRFTQILQSDPAKYDHEYAIKLLHGDSRRYKLYLESFEARKPEILPRLLIDGDACPRLVEAIPTAVYKEGTEDVLGVDTMEADVLDSIRYTLHSHNVKSNREPEKSFVERHLREVKEREPGIDFNDLVWAARKAEEDYKALGNNLKPFDIPLEGTRSAKVGRRRLQ